MPKYWRASRQRNGPRKFAIPDTRRPPNECTSYSWRTSIGIAHNILFLVSRNKKLRKCWRPWRNGCKGWKTKPRNCAPRWLGFKKDSADSHMISRFAKLIAARKSQMAKENRNANDYNERWNGNLLQGLGQRTANCVLARLAPQRGRLGRANAVLWPAWLSG